MSGVCFHSIVRKFPGTGIVIDNVSFRVASGEFVTLLGPSGCGKSTFLRLAAGLDEPSEGSIEIEFTDQKYFRGFVFQEPHLLPWRKVLENVALPMQLIGDSPEDARSRAEEALVRVGLKDALTKFPNQLSGGMKMRVAVARALVTRPRLLLMDEPFAALDETTRHRLQEDLHELWLKEKMTILFVTHSVSEAVFLGSKAVVFSPRPAKVLLELPIDLPSPRRAALRLDAQFNEKMRIIYEAIEGASI